MKEFDTSRCPNDFSWWRLPERLFNRWTLLGKKLRPGRSDVETILQTDSKLTIDHDRWFVAKAHPGLNRRLIATHKVSPLVTVEPDAVTSAMRQTRRLVIGTKARVRQNFSGGVINCFARRANLRCRETRVLRLSFNVPNVALTLSWLAK